MMFKGGIVLPKKFFILLLGMILLLLYLPTTGLANTQQFGILNYQDGESYHYQVYTQRGAVIEEGEITIAFADAGPRRVEIKMMGYLNNIKLDETIVAQTDNPLSMMLGLIMALQGYQEHLVELIFSSFWIFFLDIPFDDQNFDVGWSFETVDQEGNRLSTKVVGMAEFAGIEGYLIEFSSQSGSSRLIGEFCLNRKLIMPLYIKTEQRGNIYQIELLNYQSGL